MPDEPTSEPPPRRRRVLLAMLVAATLLLAIAGSGAFAGGGGSARSSDESTGLTRDAPAAGAASPTHRGRHCHHEGNRQAPQQAPTGQPPV